MDGLFKKKKKHFFFISASCNKRTQDDMNEPIGGGRPSEGNYFQAIIIIISLLTVCASC